ncbi:MAG: AAA family ATPase [Proteobacteria bacterium]|nr:AAA family ATPase [Pseudomonadota bacterium]
MDLVQKELTSRIRQSSGFITSMKAEISRVIVGQDHMVDCAIIALLTGGHILLEGVPGLAKTLLCNTLAKTVDCQFKRIQFTPDLLPADLIGSMAYRQQDGTFYARKGPIFANLVLADEINRAPAKVQSALLEAMQEKQVTIGDQTYPLPRPFLVIATQNPIDQEGTYPLPEAQIDRFMMKVVVDYPSFEEERQILSRMTSSQQYTARMIVPASSIISSSSVVESIYIDERIQNYIVGIVYATRHPESCGLNDLSKYIARGAGPRGTLSLATAARGLAFMNTSSFVGDEEVKALAVEVLQHRIALTYEAEADGVTSVDIIQAILSRVKAP